MNNELIIGLGGLILSALTYFAGVYRTEKRLNKEESDNRTQAVFDKYMEFRRSGYTAGYHGLYLAGAATLLNDEEIRAVCRRVSLHGEKTPLGSEPDIFDGVDLKKLFEYIAENDIKLMRTDIQEIISEIQA